MVVLRLASFEVEEFRTGGYGLQIARTLAQRVDCRWADGRVVVEAEFR
jgi:hypothetical protein